MKNPVSVLMVFALVTTFISFVLANSSPKVNLGWGSNKNSLELTQKLSKVTPLEIRTEGEDSGRTKRSPHYPLWGGVGYHGGYGGYGSLYGGYGGYGSLYGGYGGYPYTRYYGR